MFHGTISVTQEERADIVNDGLAGWLAKNAGRFFVQKVESHPDVGCQDACINFIGYDAEGE